MILIQVKIRTKVVDQRVCVCYMISKVAFTPAALEEPSTYLETAIMEMIKKMMEALTHLRKSFKVKEATL